MDDSFALKFLQVDTTTILTADMLLKMYTKFNYDKKLLSLCVDADKHYCIVKINFDYKNNFIKKAVEADNEKALEDFSKLFVRSIFNYKRFIDDEDILELYNEAIEWFEDYQLNIDVKQ